MILMIRTTGTLVRRLSTERHYRPSNSRTTQFDLTTSFSSSFTPICSPLGSLPYGKSYLIHYNAMDVLCWWQTGTTKTVIGHSTCPLSFWKANPLASCPHSPWHVPAPFLTTNGGKLEKSTVCVVFFSIFALLFVFFFLMFLLLSGPGVVATFLSFVVVSLR